VPDVLRAAAIQMPHGASVDGNLATAGRLVAAAVDAGAGLVLLPEYFFAAMPRTRAATTSTTRPDAAPNTAGHKAAGAALGSAGDTPTGPATGTPAGTAADTATGEGAAAAVREFLGAASRRAAVAGNVVERQEGVLGNVGVVYEAGRPVLEQVKLHPMPREVDSGIVGGVDLAVADVAGRSTGVLVCADVLYPEVAQNLALRGAQVLLNPVLSALRRPDPDRQARKALYIARAYDAGAFVIKASGFLADHIAGRSLIAAPWGMLAEASDEQGECLVLADLDFAALAAFRAAQGRFPPRRPDLYRTWSR
jgi:predicted amidohydrolase